MPEVSEDRPAQLPARRAQAHALADAQEQARDLGVPEHEAAAGPDALVAGVHVLAGRAGGARIGVVLGRLADGHREAERVTPDALGRHAAVSRTAVGIAPLAAAEAVQPDPVTRVLRTPRTDDRRIGLGPCHVASVLDSRASSPGTSAGPQGH